MTRLPTYRQSLRQELERRIEKNPRYSIRSFARALKLSDGALSQILSGKRIPSVRTAKRLIAALEISPKQADEFMQSLADVHRARGMQRLSPVFRKWQMTPDRPLPEPRDLSIELFRIIADWYHVGILELTYLEDFRADIPWIASQLGISKTEARLAVDRLLELGLLQKQGKRLVKTDQSLATADRHLTTSAHRRYQRETLEKAIASLENDPIEIRNHTGIMMSIDPDLIPEARRAIEEFSQALCQRLESGKRKKVYHLNVCLFPVQAQKDQKE